MLSRVKSGGGAGCFLSGAGLIACKDVGLFEAFSCPWPPSPTFYKLLEIEREALARKKSEGKRLGRPKGRLSAVTKLTGKDDVTHGSCE